MYYQFLANVTFGNEVYTVSRVDFVEKGRNQIPVGGIDYDDNSLDITFFSAPDHKHYVFFGFLPMNIITTLV